MDTAIHDMIFRLLTWAKYFGLAFAFIAVFTAGCICLWDIARAVWNRFRVSPARSRHEVEAAGQQRTEPGRAGAGCRGRDGGRNQLKAIW